MRVCCGELRRRQERQACRLSLHRHRLCAGRCSERHQAVALRRRSTAPQAVKARNGDGRRQARCPGLHDFPAQHWTTLHSTNPLERLNGEIKRRTEVVGAILLEQNDEWAVRHARYMTLETIAPISDTPTISLSAVAA